MTEGRMPTSLDDTDLAIIALLQRDGRMSARAVARQLGGLVKNHVIVEEQPLKDNPNYHKSSDSVANLSWPYFTKVVGASTATVAHLAGIQK